MDTVLSRSTVGVVNINGRTWSSRMVWARKGVAAFVEGTQTQVVPFWWNQKLICFGEGDR